jgi:hypothetical protein
MILPVTRARILLRSEGDSWFLWEFRHIGRNHVMPTPLLWPVQLHLKYLTDSTRDLCSA